MEITRTSIYSGKTRTMDLNITVSELERYNCGVVIQRAFPNLTDDEREFYMTGITKEEWDELYPPEEE